MAETLVVVPVDGTISEMRQWGHSHRDYPSEDSRNKALQLIENCDCNSHAISSFADKVSLSPSRLSHLFKAETGVPLKSYITLHQVERAFMKLLCGKNITEAALEAGFDSSSHFSATVKRMMGIPASLSTKDSVFLKVPDIQYAYNDI